MSKPVSMALKTHDATMWGPGAALEHALDRVCGGDCDGWPKAMAIMLDDRDGTYQMSYVQAGMSASQMVALLEILKVEIMKREMELG